MIFKKARALRARAFLKPKTRGVPRSGTFFLKKHVFSGAGKWDFPEENNGSGELALLESAKSEKVKKLSNMYGG